LVVIPEKKCLSPSADSKVGTTMEDTGTIYETEILKRFHFSFHYKQHHEITKEKEVIYIKAVFLYKSLRHWYFTIFLLKFFSDVNANTFILYSHTQSRLDVQHMVFFFCNDQTRYQNKQGLSKSIQMAGNKRLIQIRVQFLLDFVSHSQNKNQMRTP
jgi:hypothetical protein